MTTNTTARRDQLSFNAQVIDTFRANAGVVEGLPASTPLLLLTTTGARTGEPRTSPLGYLVADGRYYINGANRGSARNPAWFHNLSADPRVTLEVGDDTFEASARTLTGAERRPVWERFASRIPSLTEWQARIEREIPIVELTPVQRGFQSQARGSMVEDRNIDSTLSIW